MEKIQLTFGSNLKSYEIGDIVYIAKNQALTLSSGVSFNDVPVAFQSYGKLNSDKSNAILLCHALTGDQYAASDNPVTGKEGWWSFMIGPGKPIDTNKYFVICANVLGGCMGSFGPKEINSELRRNFVRSEIDLSSDSLNKKIRTNTKSKIPNLLIIGENEVNDQSVTIRRYGIKEQETLNKSDFINQLLKKIKSRSLN